MTPAERGALVMMMARALAAASGEGRVSTPALTAACRAAFASWDVTPAEIGAILSAACWQHRQWRERRGNPDVRMRGYVVPRVAAALAPDSATPPRACSEE